VVRGDSPQRSERVGPHLELTMIRTFRGTRPIVHPSCFIEDSAQLIGAVEIGEDSSVWFNTVIRGDVNEICIGRRTNIQDLSMVHVLSDEHPTRIGDDVTVGHHVVLHGCTLGSRILVGMAAVVMDGVEVGDDCLIAAGALLPPGMKVPSGSVVVGSPAKVRRAVTAGEREWFSRSAQSYVSYAREHLASR
jgi:carbonic anhydrase/acetyltransferase-like protein (isoleucine patch superfamily)